MYFLLVVGDYVIGVDECVVLTLSQIGMSNVKM